MEISRVSYVGFCGFGDDFDFISRVKGVFGGW